jgi:DNA-binding NtrC family response regulator
VGRSRSADIRLDSPLISRHHARLSYEGEPTLTDLGSANGTKVNGERLEANRPAIVGPSGGIEIGGALLVVQRATSEAPFTRVWSHQYFESRLESACRREGDERREFSVVRLRFSASLEPSIVVPLLLRECGDHVLANYGASEYEFLVMDSAAAADLCQNLERSFQRAGMVVTIGSATFPRDGTSAHELFAHAGCDRTRSRESWPEPSTNIDVAMHGTLSIARRVAKSQISVLLLGETGVGKEVMAANLHLWSERTGPFTCVNCAGLTENLLESELFGSEKGAFTGALGRAGLVEAAQKGTVFLDEIGELPLPLQAKLLRVLQERVLRRVGGVKEIPVDVRFLAATNRNLEEEVSRGTFRQDLYFRLSGVTLEVPPLRQRKSEILTLARRFAAEYAARAEPPVSEAFTAAAERELLAYSWPGNIRELRNVIERAVLLAAGEEIDLLHLPIDKMRRNTAPTPVPASAPADISGAGLTLAQIEERERIVAALSSCAWNQTAAASLLRMPRRTLVSKLRGYRIPRPHDSMQRERDVAPRSAVDKELKRA